MKARTTVAVAVALLGAFFLWRLGECSSGQADESMDNLSTTVVPLEAPPEGSLPQPSLQAEGSGSARIVVVGTPEPSGANLRVADDPKADPCAAIRAERNALSEEVKSLRSEVLRLGAHGGLSPWEHFLHSPDSESITDEEGLAFLKGFIEADFPFYLYPGEATWIVEHWRDENRQVHIMEACIRFLGPQRVLAEAPPEWIERRRLFYDHDEWLSIFGTPMPD